MLGNGKQRKSYLYIQDCIDAIFMAIEKGQANVNIFNLGTGRILRSERFYRLDLRCIGRAARAELFGRRSRLDRG